MGNGDGGHEQTHIVLSCGHYARGRNGYFKPRDMNVYRYVNDSIVVEVFSGRRGKRAPVMLELSKQDALDLGMTLIRLA